MRRRSGIPILVLTLAAALPATAAEGPAVYRAMGLRTGDVLSGTILSAPVVRGGGEQVVGLVTYFTGKKEKTQAVNVRLAVFQERGKELTQLYGRDLGAQHGGSVGDGNLQLFDLDGDGLQEIIVSYDAFDDPLITQRIAEVILFENDGFEVAWSGPFEYDATRAAREVPQERRDRYTREIDYAATRRTRGLTLYLNKRMVAVAGSRLDPPREVQETFPLRKPQENW